MSHDPPVVLVVEDDVEMNELEQELLNLHGFQTVGAYTGDEALAVWGESDADAIVLDIMLPGMDGFETCCQFRRRQAHKLAIIIVSALVEDESRQRGLDSGADAYFAKPFDPDELVDKLHQLLSSDEKA